MNILTITEYSEKVGLPEEELIGLSRKHIYTIPRQIYWLYLNCNGKSYRNIAEKFDRKHPSILVGIRTVKNLIETNDSILKPYLPFIEKFLHHEHTNESTTSNFIAKRIWEI